MAALTATTMGELNKDRKPVYALFQKAPRHEEPLNTHPEAQTSSDLLNILPTSVSTSIARNSSGAFGSLSKGRAPLHPSVALNTLEQTGPDTLELDPNNERRKRRRTASPTVTHMHMAADGEASGEISIPAPIVRRSPRESGNRNIFYGVLPPVENGADFEHLNIMEALIPNTAEVGRSTALQKYKILGVENETETTDTDSTVDQLGDSSTATRNPQSIPPKTSVTHAQGRIKKILKFNPKTGTIGSPPTKKVVAKNEKGAKSKTSKSRIVTIRYGPGLLLPASVGTKIDEILSSPKTVLVQPKKPPEPAKVVRPAQPPKSLHPLFLSRNNPKKNSASPREGSPKESCTIDLTGPTEPFVPKSTPLVRTVKSGFSGFGRSSKILKFPGAVDPAWPWQGMVHVRGIDQRQEKIFMPVCGSPIQSRSRKSKYMATQIPHHEDLLRSFAARLGVDEVLKIVREINLDDYPPPSDFLRLPSKHLESGQHIQRRIRPRLHANLDYLRQVEDSGDAPLVSHSTHPALTRLYNTTASSLSAFDNGQCEAQTWTQKYSPRSASEVLQIGREALILKTWLQKLTVTSVESGLGDPSKGQASSSGRPEGPGKRKRKTKKVDDFVVSSDEESDWDEITEPEDEESLQRNPRHRKTVVRGGDKTKESGKLKNAVVISGPHGSGKTAAVYAVAKELDFEVFEVNSGSRRSGKDIIEKVGDMTRNHLVQRQNLPSLLSVDDDGQRIEQALADDIQSGRQDTMNSFFKTKNAMKTTPLAKQPAPLAAKHEELKDTPVTKPPPKEQKQSLILIEEVDILYEEDKNFWATILNLMVQSKRPIIMTCTDESLVPELSSGLHAIIRFTPPPIDLATDYMLLVAACEGHVLSRDAAMSIYKGRNLDLRASISELNFWCQFGVGDQKHGGDWYYRRGVGNDLDASGHQIRVVSEDTYHAGMGWICRDLATSGLDSPPVEEEILHGLWDGWDLDAGDWQTHLPMNDWAGSLKTQTTLSALNMYDDFAECMSVSDLCSGSIFAPTKQVRIDASLPPLPAKVLNDTVLGHGLLQASPIQYFQPLGKAMSIYLKSQARSILQIPPRTEAETISLITNPPTTNLLTRHHLSLAFDPISYSSSAPSASSTTLDPSCFDRTISIITIDIAPYVRSIVAFDQRLQRDRLEKGCLLSEGGSGSGGGFGRRKRMRNTRSVMSALEGGARSTTRRDRYFGDQLNAWLVERTGGVNWAS